MIQKPSPRIGRSVWALFAGFLVVVALSILTDFALHLTRVFPPLGQPMAARLLLLATCYRTLYAIAGSYITARLAPYLPMQHALLGGVIGMFLSISGAIATWNRPDTYGAHWYPVALIVLAIPQAWLGGKIFMTQARARAEA